MIAALALVAALGVTPAAPDSDSLAVAAAEGAARPVTLAQAVAMASRNALAVIQAEGQRRDRRAALSAAKQAFIPSLGVSASANRQLPTRTGQTTVQNGQVVTLAPDPWSLGASLSANVDLFTGGRRLFDLSQARANVTAADADLDAQRYAAVLTAKQEFFAVLAARESEGAAAAQLRQAEEQLVASELKLRARAVTRSDSLRSEIAVHNARLALLQARTDAAVADASLTRALGSDTPLTAAADDSLDRAGLAVPDDSLRALALRGPAVAGAQATYTAAEAAVRAAWGSWLPSVTASYVRSGNASSRAFDLSPDGTTYNGSLRFSLSLPIFDQGQRAQQLTAARVARDDAAAALRDARLAAVASFTQYLGAYRAAEERVATQTATVAAAEEDLRVQKDKYDIGTSTLLDVLTSQTTLDQARRDLIQARYDMRVARAQLEALAGRDL